MTKIRNYEGSTDFSNWFRVQEELDSHLGYRNYDIDFVWSNANTGLWMFLEEKRYGHDIIKAYEHSLFAKINKLCAKDKKYRGYHLVAFENTTPDDGRMQVNYKDITKEDFLRFLKFDAEIIKKYMSPEAGPQISQKLTPKFVEHVPKLK